MPKWALVCLADGDGEGVHSEKYCREVAAHMREIFQRHVGAYNPASDASLLLVDDSLRIATKLFVPVSTTRRALVPTKTC